jgi:hypothetical protein
MLRLRRSRSGWAGLAGLARLAAAGLCLPAILAGSCGDDGRIPCDRPADCGATNESLCLSGYCETVTQKGDMTSILGLTPALYYEVARARYTVYHPQDADGTAMDCVRATAATAPGDLANRLREGILDLDGYETAQAFHSWIGAVAAGQGRVVAFEGFAPGDDTTVIATACVEGVEVVAGTTTEVHATLREQN